MAFGLFLIWVGSAIAGWFSFYEWLAVPPAIFLIIALKNLLHMEKVRKYNGLSRSMFKNPIIIAGSLKLVVWNFLLNGAIFGLSWLIAQAFH